MRIVRLIILAFIALLSIAAGAVRQAGSVIAAGAGAVGGAIHRGLQELTNPDNYSEGPCRNIDENGC